MLVMDLLKDQIASNVQQELTVQMYIMVVYQGVKIVRNIPPYFVVQNKSIYVCHVMKVNFQWLEVVFVLAILVILGLK
jgi:hypothetical protein